MIVRPAVPLVALLLLAPRPGLAQDAPQEPPKEAPQEAPRDAPKIAGVDVPAPKRAKSVAPQYPAEAQAMGMRGIVILELVVGPDGKVVSARVTRSVPPFDDAALTAVRQWEYEITKVGGQPVSVILTVPIEFKMRLPEIAREEGIPELRQGVLPPYPAGAGTGEAIVTAEVTLDPDGHVAEAHIKSGDSPWSESVIQAVRTWRFSPVEGGGGLVFDVRAEFGSSKGGPHVDLRASSARHVEAPAPEAAAAAAPSPAPASPAPASPAPASPSPAATQPSAAPSPVPSPEPSPVTAASPAPVAPSPAPASPAPSPSPAPEATTRAPSPPPAATAPSPAPTPAPASDGPAATTRRPPAPQEEIIRNPAGGPPVPPKTPPAAPVVPPEAAAGASPAPGALATPAAPQVGISAVRDVTLAAGVPDLVRGRRPVAPPIARMQGISGVVDVHFAVDAAGSSTVREVSGPEQLKEAAKQTVASWSFRRASPERLLLAATFDYKGDTATAAVRPQE